MRRQRSAHEIGAVGPRVFKTRWHRRTKRNLLPAWRPSSLRPSAWHFTSQQTRQQTRQRRHGQQQLPRIGAQPAGHRHRPVLGAQIDAAGAHAARARVRDHYGAALRVAEHGAARGRQGGRPRRVGATQQPVQPDA
eukprot:117286-Prymnesium_polylepis.1